MSYMFSGRANIFNIRDEKMAYFHVPKCGSRTMLGWCALVKQPDLLKTNPEWFEQSKRFVEYPEITGFTITQRTRNVDFPIKLCIVRDPVDRFLSGFTNRVLFHNRIPNINSNITFDEFFNTLEEKINTQQYGNFRNHTRSLIHFLGKDPSFYTHIVNIKEINKAKELIENTYNTVLPDLHLQKSGNVKKPEISQHQIDWIKKRYSDDYEIYGKWL